MHASLISIAHLLCTCMSWGGGGGPRNFINGTCSLFYCTLKTPIIRPHTTKHHLHYILLYSLQHQLPTRSVLHHDDPPDLRYTVELRCPGKERRNKGITDAHKKGEQVSAIPGEKNAVIARNCAWKTAINAPNYAVFKTLYLLDCVI